jgi:3-oxoacyl-[acyl-carrier protein] reductase
MSLPTSSPQPSPLTTTLSPHLALITGSTGGIGLATAHLLASHGCSLALHYHTAASTASSLLSMLHSLGVRASTFQADLSTYDGVRQLHADVVQQMGHPTILFNNAGVTGGKSGVKDIGGVSIEEFEATWRTNCGTGFLLTQLCVPAMEAASFGRIIFCSSVAGFTGGVVGPHYASSKSAIHGLVHWLAGNLAKKGITVNGVAPALIQGTKMLPGDEDGSLANRIPIGRLGMPEEVAETVLWMVKTGYVTNKVIAVDGGAFIQ